MVVCISKQRRRRGQNITYLDRLRRVRVIHDQLEGTPLKLYTRGCTYLTGSNMTTVPQINPCRDLFFAEIQMYTLIGKAVQVPLQEQLHRYLSFAWIEMCNFTSPAAQVSVPCRG